MEFMTSWEKRGREKERQELLLRQLQHKLGMLPASLQRRLKSLCPAQLEQLSVDLFNFAAVTDLTAWLEQHSSKHGLQPSNVM